MVKRFFLFIVLIRALAAIVITNSHYTGVYPSDLIANGGLLGDVLFFAVSGFCLASTKGSFRKWYLRRFIRVYVPMWMIRVVYIILGAFVVTGWQDVFNFFVFPRDWHFVSSIILLYVPLFFVSKYLEMNKKNYWCMAGNLLLIQLVLYFSIYNYSFYHIDVVREPMIEFLFFQSMLLGLHFRWICENDGIKNSLNMWKIGGGLLLCVAYFVSKMIFVKIPAVAPYQIVNQILLWSLLYVLFDIFMNLEGCLSNLKGKRVWRYIVFISDRTLEIYLVQYVIIARCNIGLFPVNWLILTTAILVAAVALRWCSQQIITRIRI